MPLYGLSRFGDLFTPRQLATLCSFAQAVQEVHEEMLEDGLDVEEHAPLRYAHISVSCLIAAADRKQHAVPHGIRERARRLSNTFAASSASRWSGLRQKRIHSQAAAGSRRYLEDNVPTIADAIENCRSTQVRSGSDICKPASDHDDRPSMR